MTDPAQSTPPRTPAGFAQPAPPTALRLLSSADDVVCTDDLCLPASASGDLGVPADATPLDDAAPLDVQGAAR